VRVTTAGKQCTSNFVFMGADGGVYLGQAAHCAAIGAETTGAGCSTASQPLGTAVQIEGATRPGTLAYSSWLTMQAGHESNPLICQYNDFALVKIDPADVGRVNPSVPGWGGPIGVGDLGAAGSAAYAYLNSSSRLAKQLSLAEGTVAATEASGWSHAVYLVTPGIPGDSGSGLLNKTGAAAGVMSQLRAIPLPGSNGIGDLGRELGYMRVHSAFTSISLVPGTVPFSGNIPTAISRL
jgi:hypothetical protein